LLASAVTLGGCCSCVSCTPQPLFVDGGPLPDVRILLPRDVGRDARDTPEIFPEPCSFPGNSGAHCRASGAQCTTGATCWTLPPSPTTIQELFDLAPGVASDPIHPDYPGVDLSSAPELAPFHGAAGSVCASLCDTASFDRCGTCTTCSAQLTQMPIVQAFGGVLTMLRTEQRLFGATTGICRLDCTYEPTTRGAECPDDAFTCDRFSNVCVEACTTDAECNTQYGVTYEGTLVTLVTHDHADVCDLATARCGPPRGSGSSAAQVGSPCASAADCAPEIGICLQGGHCAELGCPNPNTATSVCGGTSAAPLGCA